MPTPMKFDDKETAYAYAKGQNELKPDDFCPLLRAMCRKDCECWSRAWVLGNKPYRGGATLPSNEWHVYPCQCTNAMFSGGRFEL